MCILREGFHVQYNFDHCPNMTPSEKFEISLRQLRTIFKIIGQDVLADRFRRGVSFYIILVLLLGLVTFLLVDLWATNDLQAEIRFIQMSISIGVLQVILKYLWLADLRPLRPTIDFLSNIHRQNSQPTDPYYIICDSYTRIAEQVLRGSAAAYVLLIIFVVIFGMYESYASHEPMLYVYFPFVREYTAWQFAALNIFNGVVTSLATIVVPTGDIFLFMVAAYLTMIPKIIRMQLKDFSDRLDGDVAMTDGEIKRRWMHYIGIHLKYKRYIDISFCIQSNNDLLFFFLFLRIPSHIRILDQCLFKFCLIQFLTSTNMAMLAITVAAKVIRHQKYHSMHLYHIFFL